MKKTLYVKGVIVGEVDLVPGDHASEVAQMTDFLKSKGLHREVTKEQAMFRQALSFCKTAADIYERDLMQAPRNGLAAAPFAVNSAFSIELYLKTLHKLVGSEIRGHELLKLYDALPVETRETVLSHAQKHAAGYGVAPAPSAESFRQSIAELNTAFVDWRYCYETGAVTEFFKIPPTILVMVAVDQACRQLGAT
jgi:hypothetical protein